MPSGAKKSTRGGSVSIPQDEGGHAPTSPNEINNFKLMLQEALRDDVTRDLLANTFSHQVATQLGEMKNKISTLERENSDLHARLGVLERKQDDTVSSMSMLIDEQEQYTRRETLRISGMPESKDEQTEDTIITTLNKEMALEPPITKNDIARCHRIGPQTDNRPRHILVKFVSYKTRSIVWSAKNRLKDSRKKIFVSEDLTRTRAALFYEARQEKRAAKIKDAWTHDGTVLIKSNNGLISKFVSKNQ